MTLNCFYRRNVEEIDGEETADCGLLAPLVADEQNANAPRLPRAACEVCEFRDTRTLLNGRPMFASLLYQFSEGCDESERAQLVSSWAESTIAGNTLSPSVFSTFSCDVILLCSGDEQEIETSMTSILAQDRVFTTIHLVGQVPNSIATKVTSNARATVHALGITDTLSKIAVSLLQCYSSEFVCTLSAGETLLPNVIATAIEHLLYGNEEPDNVPMPERPSSSAATQSTAFVDSIFVIRRAAIADMRSASLKPATSNGPAAESIGVEICSYEANVRRACDVVLPFYGQLDYVEEAIESLLAQEGIDVVLHLVDDASKVDTSSFLRKWAKDSRVRAYRNEANIGQFMSFNNVSEFVETEFLASQDGDDVSLPGRLAWSVETLTLTDADFFAGASEVFESGTAAMEAETVAIRRSRYPHLAKVRYFAENPTLVTRVSAFRDLGGFTDFGNRLLNRCSVDTELQFRAYFSGRRFAISDKLVLRFRRHVDSSTNNDETGFGSEPRAQAERLAKARGLLFQRGAYDPRSFGALHKYRGVTRRLDR